ncbi:SET domain-containing protein [Karstenula rhodostoma CBS 690.94]|uniref:SET domain-containing protein n=1 Tax=Karstenula rhodostoma CBS 690.94 TaxID=1392251 RepID=A0A9P4PD22_9PLEO|nr:SET domain-containing protein [Karstenula rhodostoma CBS 690.94]
MRDESTRIPLERCADLVILTDTPKGRGIFATKLIPAKTVLDTCPVLILGIEENKNHIEHTSLYHYTYNWPITDKGGKKQKAQAVIFGLGSMFNHSSHEQNVVWDRDLLRQTITYRALRDIQAGEELCISYGDHLTFKDADAPPQPRPEDEIEQLNRIQLD